MGWDQHSGHQRDCHVSRVYVLGAVRMLWPHFVVHDKSRATFARKVVTVWGRLICSCILLLMAVVQGSVLCCAVLCCFGFFPVLKVLRF